MTSDSPALVNGAPLLGLLGGGLGDGGLGGLGDVGRDVGGLGHGGGLGRLDDEGGGRLVDGGHGGLGDGGLAGLADGALGGLGEGRLGGLGDRGPGGGSDHAGGVLHCDHDEEGFGKESSCVERVKNAMKNGASQSCTPPTSERAHAACRAV